MFNKILSYFFSKEKKENNNDLESFLVKINELENYFNNLSDLTLKNNTFIYKKHLINGGNVLDILPLAFANIKEAIKRVFKIILFDVQILGALALNNNCISEMKTGEGKTITSTLPAYLNSMYGKGVHIVTVNEYLANRDFLQNRELFNFLGVKVGLNINSMSLKEKIKSYLCDITYGTANEYGFDYLRDNISLSLKYKVQRKELYYAIIDEVDSVLIDESRTPLIISGSGDTDEAIYFSVNNLVNDLNKGSYINGVFYGDFVVDKKSNNIYLTDSGILKTERLMLEYGLVKDKEFSYSSKNIKIMHYIISSLKAHWLYKKNVDYIVEDNNIYIVDEFTGRIMYDRKWSDGLHQAIEAKERVLITQESQTLASITLQNYFRLYKKLSGMSGTAVTESNEFKLIYNLNVVIIPTNKPMIRKDLNDLIYLNEEDKINAIINDIKYRKSINQPVLVGTISIEKSELISKRLKKIGIKHNVLNAKLHFNEAEIISQAGKLGAVTISTNMAGRGTDIVLGGNWKNDLFLLNNNNVEKIKCDWKKNHDLVVKLGGLHVIGTERHESRRIDNQLRGRSGRQGDPGSSVFYISLDDDLINIFVPSKIIFFMKKIGNRGECINNKWVSESIEKAQIKIEDRNFNIRKQLLEYDNISNEHRKLVYNKRNIWLEIKKYDNEVKNIILNVINYVSYNLYNKKTFINDVYIFFSKNFNIVLDLNELNDLNYKNVILNKMFFSYLNICKKYDSKLFTYNIRNILVKTLDDFWKEYLYSIDYLREYINMRCYGQLDLKYEYKKESYVIFYKMINEFNLEVARKLFNWFIERDI